MTATDTAFQILAPLAMLLVLLPLPWHWSARNIGTLLYIAWSFTGSLVFFVNSIIWSGNTGNPTPVWCDIATKFMVGMGVAIPAVSLCINRRLYNIATMKQVSLSPQQQRREVMLDLLVGLGVPVLVMALHYIVQGHRFDVVEDIGCYPTTYVTPLSVPLYFMWPSLLGLISMCYSVLSIHAFMKQRRTFNAIFRGQNQLNFSRYSRLMALAATDILLDLPLSIFILWSNVNVGFSPWISWSDTHYNFSNVQTIPAASLQAVPGAWAATQITRWGSPILGIIFFLFFGLAGESLSFYQGVARRILVLFRLRAPALTLPIASTPTTPSAHRLGTKPSIIHIHVDKTSDADADLERGDAGRKMPDFIALQSAEAKTIEFPGNNAPASLDNASDVSIELGAVHVSRLSSPLETLAGSKNPMPL